MSTLEERLRAKLERRGECLIWTGAVISSGYGHISRGRRGEGMVLVHRAAHELWIGPIPEGFQVDHVVARGCTSKLCCEPGHLEAVTQRVNRERQGGSTRGRRVSVCKRGHDLTAEDGRNSRGNCRLCANIRARAFSRNLPTAIYLGEVAA